LRRLAGSGWSAGAVTLQTATFALVLSTAEYCAPVWCRSAHTRLIDSAINDALRIVTGCLRPTPADNLPILAGIQPAELRRKEAPLSLARRAMEPGHLLLLECGVVGEHYESPSFHPRHRHPTSGMALPKAQWVRLNHLRAVVERFCSCSPQTVCYASAACECGAEEQTVDHVVLQCPIHRPPHGLHGLTVLDDETIEWLLNTCCEV